MTDPIKLMGFDYDPRRRFHDEIAQQIGASVILGKDQFQFTRSGVAATYRQHDSNDGVMVHWAADLPPPGTAIFKVYPEGFVSFAAKILGAKEVEVGHSSFDNAFMVRGDPAELVKRAWPDDLCKLMLEMWEAHLESHGRHIELKLYVREATTEVIARGLNLLLGLGEQDVFDLAALRALPEATFFAALGEVQIPGPSVVRFARERVGDGVHTRVRTDVHGVTELNVAVRTKAGALGGMTIDVVDGEIVGSWDGIESEPANLTGALDLLRSLVATPSAVVYR